jgi:DNA-directed RNA polymerase delta subunit
LKHAEYQVKGKAPRSNIYTALNRGKDFVKVLPDTWALAEWHPEIAAAKQDATKAKKPKKRGRPKGSKSKVTAEAETTEPAA